MRSPARQASTLRSQERHRTTTRDETLEQVRAEWGERTAEVVRRYIDGETPALYEPAEVADR